jgi:hypothetical protein
MIDIVLLVLKIAILTLLYLFVWQVVRGAVADVRGSAAAPAPDVPLPDGSRPVVAHTSEDRHRRREERATDRTETGQVMDLTRHISPRLIVEESPIVPVGVIFPLEGWITVGRASNSDIVLDEPFVSSTHARLFPRGQFYVVEDLGSTNGTFVNEREVSDAELRLDARVRIGETVFRYEE